MQKHIFTQRLVSGRCLTQNRLYVKRSAEMGIDMTFGERIKQRRTELGFSVEEIAEQLGKNRATIYRYENNDIENFPITILEPLALALQTTPAYLMGWSDSVSGNGSGKIDLDVVAHSKEEAIYIAMKNMLLANGEEEKAATITKEEAGNLYRIMGFDSLKTENDAPSTIAAHFDGRDYTEEELDEIAKFAEFVKSKRK